MEGNKLIFIELTLKKTGLKVLIKASDINYIEEAKEETLIDTKDVLFRVVETLEEVKAKLLRY